MPRGLLSNIICLVIIEIPFPTGDRTMSRMKIKRKTDEPKKTTPILPIALAIGALLVIAAGYYLATPRDQVDPNFVPEVTGAPRLKVDKESVDLGDIKFGKTVYASFKLTNVGDQILYLKNPSIDLIEGC